LPIHLEEIDGVMIIEVIAGIEMIVGEIVAIETTTIGTIAAIETAIETATETTLDETEIGVPMAGTCAIIVETFGLGAMSGDLFDL
jgi:hypothetical protein